MKSHFDIGKVPRIWRFQLDRLLEADYTAIIAGGCLRDLYCNRIPKDIDIFISYEKPQAAYGRVAHFLGGEWTSKDYDQITAHCEITYVARQKGYLPTEIIGLSPIKAAIDIIRRFDYGLNQICIDGDKLVYTEAFEKDFKEHTFTLTHAATYERSLKRYKAWAKKYPGWPLKKSGIVVLHEYYKSFERPGSPAREHPLEPA